jgi:hypothetical protein
MSDPCYWDSYGGQPLVLAIIIISSGRSKKNEARPPEQGMLAVSNCYIIRYFVNIFAMFLVYRNMWMLVGTGLGLTVMKHVTVIREYIASKKRPWKKSP